MAGIEQGYRANVDKRTVEELVHWLDIQMHLQRMVQTSSVFSEDTAEKKTCYPNFERFRKGDLKLLVNTVMGVKPSPSPGCSVCHRNHTNWKDCTILPLLTYNDKWKVVKIRMFVLSVYRLDTKG